MFGNDRGSYSGLRFNLTSSFLTIIVLPSISGRKVYDQYGFNVIVYGGHVEGGARYDGDQVRGSNRFRYFSITFVLSYYLSLYNT